MLKSMRFIMALWLCFLGLTSSAQANEYIKPSLSSLMKTLVRFGAVSLKEPFVLDSYGRVVECDIYIKHYQDDFTWQKIRGALKESIKENVATFPTAYQYDAELQLDRYDFKAGLYRFTERTAQTSVNVFVIQAHSEDQCVKGVSTFPPLVYQFVLDHPIQLAGLPLSDKEGETLLARMKAAKNNDRIIYTRFNLRVTYIAPLSLKEFNIGGKKSATPMVTQESGSDEVVMDSRLDSIEFYEDKERTKLIYSMVP